MVSLMRTGASILLAAFCCACSIGGNGPNSLKRQYTLRELVTSAPHIVVGTVTAIDGTRQQQVASGQAMHGRPLLRPTTDRQPGWHRP